MKGLKVSSWCVVALAAASMMFAGCAKDAVLANVPRGATLVVVFDDVAAMGRSVEALLKEVALELIEADLPDMTDEILEGYIHGGAREQVAEGSPAIFAMLLADGGFDGPPHTVAMVRVKDFKAVVGDAKPDAEGVYQYAGAGSCCVEYHGMVMFGEQEAVAALKKLPPGLELTPRQRDLRTGSDVFLMADLAAVVKAARPMYDEARDGMAQAMKRSEGQPDAPKEIVAALKTQLESMDTLWGYAEQMLWAAAGGNVDSSGVDLRMALGVRPGGPLASLMEGHPALGQPLAPALPVVDKTWGAVWYSVDARKTSDAMAEYFRAVRSAVGMIAFQMQMAAMSDRPELQAAKANIDRMNGMFDEMEQLFKGKLALFSAAGSGLVRAGEGGSPFEALMVEKVADRDAYAKRIEAMVAAAELSSKAGFGMMAPAGEIKVDVKLQRDAEKVGDLSVDRFDVSVTLPEGAAPPGMPMPMDPRKLLETAWGGNTITTWMAYSDGHLLSQVGPKPDRLAELARVVKAGGGAAETPEMKALGKHVVDDANMVLFVSMSTYMEFITAVMGPAMGAGPAGPLALDAEGMKSQSVLSAAAGDGRVIMRLYMPAGELKRLITGAIMIQQMMMQQMMRPPAPAA